MANTNMTDLSRRAMLRGGMAAGVAQAANISGKRPNILFLMTDQMQAAVLEDKHPCQAPRLRELAQRGVRFRHAYTPCPICSPARASLMTGLLPHSHGVVQVTHCVYPDQAVLRTDKPHWAQRLAQAGYHTGYFGKWHIERTNRLGPFGWQTSVVAGTPEFDPVGQQVLKGRPKQRPVLDGTIRGLPGYPDFRMYGAGYKRNNATLETVTHLASKFLRDAVKSDQPWCCFASVVEPHDPYFCDAETFSRYDVDSIPVPPNWADHLKGRPNLYRRAARSFEGMSLRQKKEAAVCYYSMVTEIDRHFGELLDLVKNAGQLENTIIVFTSDHGDMMGAHNLYMKSISAFEESYSIPMILSGPGVARGVVSPSRVGLHDLAPTLLELVRLERIGGNESRSFAPALREPDRHASRFRTGFAENFGNRYWFTQRVVWDGPWKFVWNGFDFDELYNHDEDPFEMRNLASEPAYEKQVRAMQEQAWSYVRSTGDDPLLRSTYPLLRIAEVGPGAPVG